MFDASKSLDAVVKDMADMGAAMMRTVGESDDGTPLYAVLVVQGKETTGDVLALLDVYDNDDAAEDDPNPVKAMVAGPALLAALEGLVSDTEARDYLAGEPESEQMVAARAAIRLAGGAA